MKNRHKGINTILAMSVLYCSVGMAFAQAGPTGIGTRNPQGSLHVDGAKDNDATAPTLPTAAQAANDIIVDKTTGFMGVGVLTPKVPLDMRSAGTKNALGLGTTTMTAAAAAAGAVRYDAASPAGTGPAIDVSDGSTWKRVYLAPQKAVVVARQVAGLSIAPAGTNITAWSQVRDDGGDNFEPSTGIFTAPRTGVYTFLLTFNLNPTTINDGSRVESQFVNATTSTILGSVYKTFGQSMTGDTSSGGDGGATKQTQAGGSSTVTLSLAAGDKVRPKLLHNLTGSSIGLRVPNDSDPTNPNAGFNNLTIIEH